ncbi:MAG: hypothetical protein L0Y74_04490 [candidate division Zixibacteria bacterium]|nr:hypothetical protein [candidate division Zixibacteria bacterium]
MNKLTMKNKTWKFLPVVLILALALTLVSCTKLAPTAPTQSPVSTIEAGTTGQISNNPVTYEPADLFDDVVFTKWDTIQIEYLNVLDLLNEKVSRLLDINLGLDGNGNILNRYLDITLPPLCLSLPTTITIIVSQGVDKDGRLVVALDCSPDGLVFLLPLKLEYYLTEPDGFRVEFYLYNESQARDELQNSKSVEDGEVEFYIYHFSQYTIWEETGGGSISPSGQGPSKANKLDPPDHN